MSPQEWIVLAVLVGAIVAFITEKLGIDLVALLIVAVLVLSGVLSPAEGLSGFSDAATLTVAFMFVLSAGMLRSGALNALGPRFSRLLRRRPVAGLMLFMLAVSVLSAFVNNTPVVALLIPVAVQAAHSAGMVPGRLLMPLSFAAIMGGTTTLIGTSTNILVSGIATGRGLEPFGMFTMAPMGLVFLAAGVLYMVLVGRRLLPGHGRDKDLRSKFAVGDYLTEIELLPGAPSVGYKIMDSALVRELDMDIIGIRRGEEHFTLPPGDFVLQAGDLLNVRCDVGRIRALKDRAHVSLKPALKLADDDLTSRGTTLVELVITVNSPLEGRSLRGADLLRKYRAVPLAVRQREELVRERLHDVVLRAGDVVLAEVRSHYVQILKDLERRPDSPFVIVAENEGVAEMDRKRFAIVGAVLLGVVSTSALGLVPVVMGTLAGVLILVLTRCLSMKQVYEAIDWRIVFLMAGALSLGLAMEISGLADRMAGGLIGVLGPWGPVAVLSGIYLVTSVITEFMSNTASAALLTPIAISTAISMGVSPTPFLLAVAFAASASFMTPIGYQTNTMVYGAGQYKASDFLKVGAPLSLLFWILATLLIPVFHPF